MISNRILLPVFGPLFIGLGVLLMALFNHDGRPLYPDLQRVAGAPPASPPAAQPEAPWADALRTFVRENDTAQNGDLALFAHDLARDVVVGIDADRPMYLASGMKMLFLTELFRQRDLGLLSFDESVSYSWNDVRDGAPSMNRHDTGSRHKISSLLNYMIRDSDNAATDLLLKRMGIRSVERSILREDSEGFGPVVNMLDVRLQTYGQLDARAPDLKRWQLRDVRWRDAHHPRLDLLKKHIGAPYGDYNHSDLDTAYTQYYSTGRNHGSMRAVGGVFAALHRGERVSPKTDAEILTVLERAYSSGHRIRGAIPSAFTVAHKTGTQHKRICDLSLVELPGGERLVLTIAVSGGEHEAMEAYLFKVARKAWDLAAASRDRQAADLPSSGSGQNHPAARKW